MEISTVYEKRSVRLHLFWFAWCLYFSFLHKRSSYGFVASVKRVPSVFTWDKETEVFNLGRNSEPPEQHDPELNRDLCVARNVTNSRRANNYS